MAEAKFAVVLEDQMSGAAGQAASALQDLQSSIQAETSELRNMQQAMRAMKADASSSGSELAALAAKVDAKKNSIAAATREYVNLGGSFQKLKASAGQGGDALAGLQGDIAKSLGPLNQKVERVRALIGLLGGGGLVAAAALAAVAIVALTAAVVGAVIQMAKFGLAASDAARDHRILLEGMTGNRAAAIDLQNAIASVSARVALSGQKVSDLGQKLAEAGLRGDQFRTALEAASIASSVGGSEAESAFMKAAIAAAKAGKSVDELAKKVKGQFGAASEAQMLGFRVQMEKARENTTRLFSGVKIEPFLDGLSNVTSLLDENTASGRALKTIVSTMLDPIFAAVAKAGPLAGAFFKGMVIGSLLVTIAVLKVKNAIQDAFGPSVKSNLDGMKLALYAGAAAAIVIAVAIVALAVVFGVLAVAVGLAAISLGILFLPFLIVVAVAIAAVVAVIAAFVYLAIQVKKAYDVIAGLDFGAIAKDMMQGLVNGITSGAGAVISALRALAEKMKATIKGALGIASPSKVFAEFGLNTSVGFAEGIEGGSKGVTGALNNMVQLPAPPAGKASTSTSSSSNTVTIHIHAPSGDAKDIASEVERVVSDLFEGVAIQMGAPLPEGV